MKNNMTDSEWQVFEMKAKAAWNADKQLQADFNGDFSKYLNFLQEDNGIKFKILTGSEA
jgi:hypothetical protein